MELQEEVATENNRLFEGKTVKVLIEQIDDGTAFGRTEYDAPEVDNECIVSTENSPLSVGSFSMVTISDTTAYELFGKLSHS